MERIEENIAIRPTEKPVNGKLQSAIMWSQIAEIIERVEKFPASYYLREQIHSIDCIELIPPSPRRQIIINEMNV